MLHQLVGDADVIVSLLESGRLEETAVEIREVSQSACSTVAFAHRCVQAAEEERQKDGGEELTPLANRGFQAVDEEATLTIQPALLLDEVEKQEPRQDEQRLLPVADRVADVSRRAAKPLEKLS